MNLTSGRDDRQLILSRDQHSIVMMIDDPESDWTEGVKMDLGVWAMIMPRALSQSMLGLIEFSTLDFGPKNSDALAFDMDDDLLSLFNLATIVGSRDPSQIVAKVADTWMHLPRERRVAWRHEASGNKAIHAQLIATSSPASPVFDAAIPVWLPRLIDAHDFRRTFITGPGIHWTRSQSPLGKSAIAFIDDESDNLDACLALSDCRVSCGIADGSMRQAALAAIDQLIACLFALHADPTLQDEVEWRPSGHDVMEIGAMLDEWRTRIKTMPGQSASVHG